jgi:hypothetical protein
MKISTIDREVKRLEGELLDSNNHSPVLLNLKWAKSMPHESGVYGWFENAELIYIGETGMLWKRMNDARTTQHHSLRRSLGNERFRSYKGFRHVTGKDRFVPLIENGLDRLMKTMAVSVLPVEFGRKEFEEHVVCEHDPKYNQKGERA